MIVSDKLKLIPADFDAGERADRVAEAKNCRELIAEGLADLLAHAKRMDWGEQVGLPILKGNVMVYHFAHGQRGFVKMPTGAKY